MKPRISILLEDRCINEHQHTAIVRGNIFRLGTRVKNALTRMYARIAITTIEVCIFFFFLYCKKGSR